MEIIKPPKLKKGDTVGIIAPSEPIADSLRENFTTGVAALESLGLNVKWSIRPDQRARVGLV